MTESLLYKLKLVAEFDGYELISETTYRHPQYGVFTVDGIADCWHYHEKWEWLIPVWSKFMKTDKGFPNKQAIVERFNFGVEANHVLHSFDAFCYALSQAKLYK